MKLTITILFIFLAAVSCKKDIYSEIAFTAPVFPDSVLVKATVLNDTLFTKGVSDLAVYKNYVILLTPSEDFMFQLYDAETSVKVKNFGELGRGPQQIFKVNDFSLNTQHGTLTAFHQATREIYQFYLDSVIQDKPHFMDKTSIKKYDDMTFSKAYATQQGFLLSGGKCVVYPGGARLSLFTRDGRITDAYNCYPISSSPQDSIRVGEDWGRLLCLMAISPDGCKYAEATGIGGLLETFDVGVKIEPIALKGFYKPHYYMEDNQMVFTEKTQFGFYYLAASNKYLYALSNNGKNDNSFVEKDIQVFDWLGNPVKKYKTDQWLMNVCVDEEDKKAYAITFNNWDFHLVSFDL